MPELVDITGQQFGFWTVLERDGVSHGGATWKCRCVCGTVTVRFGRVLRRGQSKSCGCKRAETIATARRRAAKKWTEARREIMHRDWPTHKDANDILADLNASPGPHIKRDEMSPCAGHWGLRRPPGYLSAAQRGIGQVRIKQWVPRPQKSAPALEAPPAPARSNSWLYAKRVIVTNAPGETDVAAWIAAHGVKRLPAAAVCQTTGTIPDADRVALAEYRAARNAEAAAQNAPRQSRLNRSISAKQSSSLRSRDYLQAKRA